MTGRRFNTQTQPKTFKERTWKEKLKFWKIFTKEVFVETDDPQAEYEEVLIYGKNPFMIQYYDEP